MVKMDTGRIVVYTPLSANHINLPLPTTLRAEGTFTVSIRTDSVSDSIRDIRIGGRAKTIKYADQTLGYDSSVVEYGTEMVPSELDEKRNSNVSLFAAAGLLYFALQFLSLLTDLFRKKNR